MTKEECLQEYRGGGVPTALTYHTPPRIVSKRNSRWPLGITQTRLLSCPRFSTSIRTSKDERYVYRISRLNCQRRNSRAQETIIRAIIISTKHS